MARLIRWLAVIKYRTDNGSLDVEHLLSELFELHDVVEHGPHWDTVIEIKITRHELSDGPLTVEEAQEI
jgi:hypothetical protein